MNRYSNAETTSRIDEAPRRERPCTDCGVPAADGEAERRKSHAGTIGSLWREAKTAVSVTILLALLLCGIYPALVWGVAQLVFPHRANGSLIVQDGRIVGSSLIGQGFTGERYFHSRPSAAGPNGYDAASSGGSNLGPLSQKLFDQVKERAEAYRSENGLSSDAKVPVDAVTASASGLDPHISVRNAGLQAARVAKARGIPLEEVRVLILKYTEGPQLGFLGDPGVNVLELNLALDAASKK